METRSNSRNRLSSRHAHFRLVNGNASSKDETAGKKSLLEPLDSPAFSNATRTITQGTTQSSPGSSLVAGSHVGLSSRSPRERRLQERKLEAYKLMLRRRSAGLSEVGFYVPQDSIYGAALVVPQVAATLAWEPTYVGKAIKMWTVLAFNVLLQIFFSLCVWGLLVQKSLEMDKDPDAWIAQGWRRIEGSWVQKVSWFQCYPHQSEQKDGGKSQFFLGGSAMDEGGFLLQLATADTLLYNICVFVFGVQIFKDLRQTVEMAILLHKLPNHRGHWIVFGSEDENVMDLQFRVGGMPFKWKVINMLILVFPKALISLLLGFFGTIFLKNTEEQTETVLNAVSLVFILDVDEMLFAALCAADIRENMDNLQPPFSKAKEAKAQEAANDCCFSFFRQGELVTQDSEEDSDTEEEDDDSDDDEDDDEGGNGDSARNLLTPLAHWAWVLGVEILVWPLLLISAATIMIWTFRYQCACASG